MVGYLWGIALNVSNLGLKEHGEKAGSVIV
jgi:hypothetical protein